ncbi:MAG: AEC family transporter [Candidatus Omnitrophota bacterium]
MDIVSLAVIKLSLVALLGFYFYKKAIINEETLRFLTFFVINLAIPFLIFTQLVENSEIVLGYSLWFFIILSIGLFAAGCFLGFIACFWRGREFKREFISLISFQNAGYLPISIAFFLFPQGLREKFLVFTFLNLLGFNIIMWSVGSFFIFKKKGEKFNLKSIFTPPITGTIIALLLVHTKTTGFIPSIIVEPIKMIGEVSFVLSAIILGSWLAKIKLKGISKKLFFVGEASFLKLIILPLLFLIGVIRLEIFSLLGLFIVLQAAMPSAASLPIIANMRGADSEFVSQGVFLTHLLSIVTIPIWLGLYLKLSGFSF